MAEVRPEEVSAILRRQLAGFEKETDMYEVGTVLQVGDGVARIYGHLHNNWIHLLATTGTLGVLAFAWLTLQCGRLVHRAAAVRHDPELRALALGGWGSFWGFQVMGLFEWNFGDVEVTIALYFLLGVLATLGARRRAA